MTLSKDSAPRDISDRDPVSRLDDETERRFYDVVACVLAGEVEISDVRPESICEEFFPFHAERVNASLNALRQRIRTLIEEARESAIRTTESAWRTR